MKTRAIYSGISIVLLVITTCLPHELILAQDQNAMPSKQQNKGPFSLLQHCPTLPIYDTLRPTMSNFGKGLLYYDCILLEHHDKTYLFKYLGEETPVLLKPTYTELELEILNQNMLFINKQSQIQIKEWIRKDKLDLNLGEVIKGFYLKPIY